MQRAWSWINLKQQRPAWRRAALKSQGPGRPAIRGASAEYRANAEPEQDAGRTTCPNAIGAALGRDNQRGTLW